MTETFPNAPGGTNPETASAQRAPEWDFVGTLTAVALGYQKRFPGKVFPTTYLTADRLRPAPGSGASGQMLISFPRDNLSLKLPRACLAAIRSWWQSEIDLYGRVRTHAGRGVLYAQSSFLFSMPGRPEEPLSPVVVSAVLNAPRTTDADLLRGLVALGLEGVRMNPQAMAARLAHGVPPLYAMFLREVAKEGTGPKRAASYRVWAHRFGEGLLCCPPTDPMLYSQRFAAAGEAEGGVKRLWSSWRVFAGRHGLGLPTLPGIPKEVLDARSELGGPWKFWNPELLADARPCVGVLRHWASAGGTVRLEASVSPLMARFAGSRLPGYPDDGVWYWDREIRDLKRDGTWWEGHNVLLPTFPNEESNLLPAGEAPAFVRKPTRIPKAVARAEWARRQDEKNAGQGAEPYVEVHVGDSPPYKHTPSAKMTPKEVAGRLAEAAYQQKGILPTPPPFQVFERLPSLGGLEVVEEGEVASAEVVEELEAEYGVEDTVEPPPRPTRSPEPPVDGLGLVPGLVPDVRDDLIKQLLGRLATLERREERERRKAPPKQAKPRSSPRIPAAAPVAPVPEAPAPLPVVPPPPPPLPLPPPAELAVELAVELAPPQPPSRSEEPVLKPLPKPRADDGSGPLTSAVEGKKKKKKKRSAEAPPSFAVGAQPVGAQSESAPVSTAVLPEYPPTALDALRAGWTREVWLSTMRRRADCPNPNTVVSTSGKKFQNGYPVPDEWLPLLSARWHQNGRFGYDDHLIPGLDAYIGQELPWTERGAQEWDDAEREFHFES